MSAYTDSINKAAKCARDFLEVYDDHLKAPELCVYASDPLMQAIWFMQVEYAALNGAYELQQKKEATAT